MLDTLTHRLQQLKRLRVEILEEQYFQQKPKKNLKIINSKEKNKKRNQQDITLEKKQDCAKRKLCFKSMTYNYFVNSLCCCRKTKRIRPILIIYNIGFYHLRSIHSRINS